MNSTRRRWQTTGSRAPGATLGLRRRAAAAAPTNLDTLCARARAPRRPCVLCGEKKGKHTRHGTEEKKRTGECIHHAYGDCL